MGHRSKGIFGILAKVLSWLVVIFTVLMVIVTLFSVFTVDKNERSVFGVRFYIVRTDSMSKSENNKDIDVHFNAGDIIISKMPKNNDDIKNLKPGDVISFVSFDVESYGQTITHMIKEIKTDDKGRITEIITYGTNTGAVDKTPVDPNFVLGKYMGKIPKVGKLFAFMKTVPGYICCILAPFLLIIVYHIVNVVVLFKRYKSEQVVALNTEKKRIEKERAENQRMMAELMALKAKLESQDKTGNPKK